MPDSKEPAMPDSQWNTPSPGSMPLLMKDDVHVWYASLAPERALLPEWTRLLSPQERLKAAAYPGEHTLKRDEACEMTREHYITYRGVLRGILARYIGIAPAELIVRTHPGGKPYLDVSTGGDTLRFSSSHSWGHALIAVTCQRNVGIDLQRIDPNGNVGHIVENRFSLQALAAFNALPSQQRLLTFFRLWSLHEAYFKYLGGAASWKDFTISLAAAPGKPAVLLEADTPTPCCLREIDSGLPGYTAALAVAGHDHHTTYWHWQCNGRG